MHRQVIPGRGRPSAAVALWLAASGLYGCGGRAGLGPDGSIASGSAGTAMAGASGGGAASPAGGRASGYGIAGASTSTGGSGAHSGAPGVAGGAPLGGAAGEPPLIDPAVCVAFAPRWRSRATEVTADCDYCLEFGSCTWPNVEPCVPGTTCVERHCATLSDPAALCACIESCFSVDLTACDDRWSAFMSCAADACASACQ